MSFYDNHYYHFNKISLSIIGQWPFQSRLKNSMFTITVLTVSSLMALQLWGLLAGITDLNIVIENIPALLMDNFNIIKLINCLCNNYKMKELLDHIKETWKIMRVEAESKILRHYAEKSRNFTIRYTFALYLTWIFYCTAPIIISGKKIYLFLPTNETYSARFLYRMEHVLDIDKYFNLLMLHGFISIFFLVSIATDCSFILCTQHACALFKCIKYNIERIRGSDFVLLNPNIADDKAYHAIISCIKSYKCALNYSCDWYKISLRSRHLLRFTLLRTTKPCQIEAGKMFIMSMENFSSILQMSLSYFTMITSLQ